MIHLNAKLASRLALGGVEAVKDSLQSALLLEHATIPLYLYALYSLDEDRNPDIAEIIQSVAVEEMLHMTLVCNIINALGGSPKLDGKDFVPKYPGPLPGGVESDLTVSLAPFSLSQLQTFLTIEQPEKPLQFRKLQALAAGPAKPMTIGEFYHGLSDEIGKLKDSDFDSKGRNQIGPNVMDNSVVVVDIKTAQQAIAVIVEQGEGTAHSPEEVVGGDLAHYYRFLEIRKGRRLVPTTGPDGKKTYTYSGDPILLDPAGVYPAPVNPTRALCSEDANALSVFDTFNYSYTSLLASLHQVFNGKPEKMRTAIGLMMTLKAQAKSMMSGSPNAKPNVAQLIGPSFEYQPTNPPIA